jgi:hypothetical protein
MVGLNILKPNLVLVVTQGDKLPSKAIAAKIEVIINQQNVTVLDQ